MNGTTLASLRPDLALIAGHVRPGARVLDIGCGDGALMAALRDTKGIDARGLEIDAVNVANAVTRGLAVVQGDADTDLADYPATVCKGRVHWWFGHHVRNVSVRRIAAGVGRSVSKSFKTCMQNPAWPGFFMRQTGASISTWN